jgi:hypothetical protein
MGGIGCVHQVDIGPVALHCEDCPGLELPRNNWTLSIARSSHMAATLVFRQPLETGEHVVGVTEEAWKLAYGL